MDKQKVQKATLHRKRWKG